MKTLKWKLQISLLTKVRFYVSTIPTNFGICTYLTYRHRYEKSCPWLTKANGLVIAKNPTLKQAQAAALSHYRKFYETK